MNEATKCRTKIIMEMFLEKKKEIQKGLSRHYYITQRINSP